MFMLFLWPCFKGWWWWKLQQISKKLQTQKNISQYVLHGDFTYSVKWIFLFDEKKKKKKKELSLTDNMKHVIYSLECLWRRSFDWNI